MIVTLIVNGSRDRHVTILINSKIKLFEILKFRNHVFFLTLFSAVGEELSFQNENFRNFEISVVKYYFFIVRPVGVIQ